MNYLEELEVDQSVIFHQLRILRYLKLVKTKKLENTLDTEWVMNI